MFAPPCFEHVGDMGDRGRQGTVLCLLLRGVGDMGRSFFASPCFEHGDRDKRTVPLPLRINLPVIPKCLLLISRGKRFQVHTAKGKSCVA